MKDREKGTKMAALFSLGCSELSDENDDIILSFLKNSSENEAEAREGIIKKHSTFFQFISVIGKYANLDPFHYKVVSAYFIGDKILENIPSSASKELAEKLCKKNKIPILSNKFKLMHNFYVFCVSPYAKEKQLFLSSMDLCRISTGRIVSIHREESFYIADVIYRPLVYRAGIIELGEEKKESMIYEKEIVGEVKKGQVVAMHWKRVLKVINLFEEKNINYYTKEALSCI